MKSIEAKQLSASVYTLSLDDKPESADRDVVSKKNIYKHREVRKILIATSVLFFLNIVLYIILTTGGVSLGFLGY